MLLTLLLALELTTRTVASSSALSSQAAAEEIQLSIAAVEERLTAKREELAALRSESLDVGNYTQRSADAAIRAIAEDIALLQSRIADLRQEQRNADKQMTMAHSAWESRVSDIEQLDNLKEQKRAIEAELTELQNSKRVFYSKADRSGRRVMLVELFDNDILVAEAGQDKEPLRFTGASRKRSFLQWATDQPASQFRFVLIVHPGTSDAFQELHIELRKHGFTTGFDLLPSEAVAVDIEHGAG